MKKQILSLTFFTLALIFAGMNNVFGQPGANNPTPIIANGTPDPYVNYLTPSGTVACAPVTTLSCVPSIDALHPQTGITYTYDVNVTISGASIHWFVTTETDIIAAINNITGPDIDPGDGTGGYILAAGTEYNTPTNTSETVGISWKSFDGTTAPVLLVTYVVDATGCTDNIEVYRIEPVFNFTLDMAALNDDGTIMATPEECVSPVESAYYDATANSGAGGLVVDYGENWLFFTVTAANFTHSWMPAFQTVYSGSVDEAIEVQWAYPADAAANTNWHTTTATTNGTGTETYTSTDPVLHSGTDTGAGTIGADDGTGECIVVRVRVDHGTNENPQSTSVTLNLGVNGTMYDANASGNAYTNTALNDLGEAANPGDPCTQTDYDDNLDYTLTPRPLIESATPASSTDPTIQNFEQKN
jgi:hypothetical protein